MATRGQVLGAAAATALALWPATAHGLSTCDPPARLVFSSPPSSAVAGRPFDGPVVVTVEDRAGNRTGSGLPVDLSIARDTGASGALVGGGAGGVVGLVLLVALVRAAFSRKPPPPALVTSRVRRGTPRVRVDETPAVPPTAGRRR